MAKERQGFGPASSFLQYLLTQPKVRSNIVIVEGRTIVKAAANMNWAKDVTFEMNGKGYETDKETLDMLRNIIPQAKETKDFSAVVLVMELGRMSGRIVEIKEAN